MCVYIKLNWISRDERLSLYGRKKNIDRASEEEREGGRFGSVEECEDIINTS